MKNKSIDNYKKYFLLPQSKIISKESIKITSFGTTTILIDDGETQILIDAFLTRPSLFRVLKSTIKTDMKLVDYILEKGDVNSLDAIFISHSHYDHALDVAYIANKTTAKIYGSKSTLNIGRGGNVPEDRLILFNINNPIKINNFTVTVLPSRHSKPNKMNNDLGVIIEKPLKQPAKMKDYTEGGSFDFLIEHNSKKILIRPSFNYIEGSLDDIRADVLLLGIGGLGKADISVKDKFYEETVMKVKPNLIIPIHWDSFFSPLTKPLKAPIKIIDDLPVGLDYIIKRTTEDQISFKMLQAFQSIIVFE